MTIQAHKATHLLAIFGGLLATNPRTTYLLGLLHTDDVTTTLCKPQILQEQINNVNFYRCTVHSDIHTVHSPTDAHLLEL